MTSRGLTQALQCRPAARTRSPVPMLTLQIKAALGYFAEQATITQPKVAALQAAVAGGDVAEAQAAYVSSRNEYEQIEVLAPGFGTLDCNIDCRASTPPGPATCIHPRTSAGPPAGSCAHELIHMHVIRHAAPTCDSRLWILMPAGPAVPG